jgi:hypothetical protein
VVISSGGGDSGGDDSGGVFLPYLLSPLFLFSAPSPLFFFFFVIFSFSPLSFQGRQVVRYGGGEEAWWQLW